MGGLEGFCKRGEGGGSICKDEEEEVFVEEEEAGVIGSWESADSGVVGQETCTDATLRGEVALVLLVEIVMLGAIKEIRGIEGQT